MIQKLLYDTDIYAGISNNLMPYDLQGWNGDHMVIDEIIKQYRPQLIIEVGTWKGLSAINMHKQLLTQNIPHEIVCVDTWLGSIEHLLERTLVYDGCRPKVLDQFLSNIIHHNAQKFITPFVQHSLTAAKWLEHMSIKADLIYIDASHEEGDVFPDMEAYWKLVKNGGIMFGDDYSPDWPGVVTDVNKFFNNYQDQFEDFAVKGGRFWFARKNITLE